MVLAARCKICGRVIEYTHEDPSVLGDHILAFHPDTSVTNFSCVCPDNPSSKRSVKMAKSQRTKKKPHVYRTTVETWQTGTSPVYCPKCKEDVIPTVRRQRHKISGTSCGGMLLMSCWPICFLPFMMSLCGKRQRNLYCPKCCTYLGTYNKKGAIQLDSERKHVSLPDIKQ